jgi:hypothetical protein
VKIEQITYLAYLLTPIFFAPFLLPIGLKAFKVSPGLASSLIRIFLLAIIFRYLTVNQAPILIESPVLEGYPMDFLLSLDFSRIGILLASEFCFAFTHLMGNQQKNKNNITSFLIIVSQFLLPLYLCSDNLMFAGSTQILMVGVFYYLIRFSLTSGAEDYGASITRSFYPLYFFLGILLLLWGIAEFGDKKMLIDRASASELNLIFWILLLVFAVPVAPWSKWLGLAVTHLPEAVTLVLVIFLSAVTWKISSIFSISYPDLKWKYKLVIYLVGIFGCAISIGSLFAAKSRRVMLGSLPSFFFSLILVSLGASQTKLLSSAYFVCLFLPVFTGIILYASAIAIRGIWEKIFIGILLALILGLPGTPVYLIFGTIGSRSLDMGVAYTLIFALLWFFYFSANVHICRRIFMDPEPPETGVTSSSLLLSPILTGFGILLCIFIVLITFYAGRAF